MPTTTPTTRAPLDIHDLFAGPGGWTEALRLLGLNHREVGWEFDRWACKTRAAAGHTSVRADVSTVALDPLVGHVTGKISSPPCQLFSKAGKGHGRTFVPDLVDAVDAGNWSARPDPDPKVWLVLEPGRWIAATRPEWIVLEQVPDVLPVWEAYARWLTTQGYSATAFALNSADYGVPQTRTRAFMVASRVRDVEAPMPTHAVAPRQDLFGGERLRWITMAEGLGWPPIDTLPPGDHPGAWVLTRPATTVAGDPRLSPPIHHANGTQGSNATSTTEVYAWAYERPATTIVGTYEPEVVAPPTYRGPGDGPRQNQPRAIRTTLTERLLLQSFPADYPVQGPKSAASLQVGNAVPPLLGAHVLAAVLGLPAPEPTKVLALAP